MIVFLFKIQVHGRLAAPRAVVVINCAEFSAWTDVARRPSMAVNISSNHVNDNAVPSNPAPDPTAATFKIIKVLTPVNHFSCLRYLLYSIHVYCSPYVKPLYDMIYGPVKILVYSWVLRSKLISELTEFMLISCFAIYISSDLVFITIHVLMYGIRSTRNYYVVLGFVN